jgi:hypothetical protein
MDPSNLPHLIENSTNHIKCKPNFENERLNEKLNRIHFLFKF